MTQTDIHTPKGFRDILPDLAQKRRKIINTIVPILEKHNFVPIETPIVEFAETLTGKYGEEERLIYKFTDRGDRNLALRFDLTVPLARYIATYNPPLPFRRYQIGQVFRGENPQRGRWREFTQLDFDTVGSDSLEEDAKIIACALDASRAIGLKKAIMAINDRKNFEGIPLEAVRSFDKINKIRESGVRQELSEKGFTKEKINEFINRLLSDNKTEDMLRIEDELKKYKDENQKDKYIFGHDYYFDSSLARGLDYYTGSIFELKSEGDLQAPSLGAGGRYNNLVGMFSKRGNLPAGRPVPAVGFSFGLDRICEIAD